MKLYRKTSLTIAAAICGAIACACGPGLTKIKQYVSSSPRKRIVVIAFSAPDNNAPIGQVSSDIFSKYLTNMGFTVINRADTGHMLDEMKLASTGIIDQETAVQAGKILGADTILTGTVAEAAKRTVERPAVYTTDLVTVMDINGQLRTVPRQRMLQSPYTAMVDDYSVSVRLTDLNTGKLLWVDSGAVYEDESTLQQAAEEVLKSLAYKLGSKFLKEQL